jgi:hypothetical protein
MNIGRRIRNYTMCQFIVGLNFCEFFLNNFYFKFFL